jgi:hypothetical protein
MSDYARTTLAFPMVDQCVETAVINLANFFEHTGDSIFPHDITGAGTLRTFFRPIADTPEKYRRPESIENNEFEPENASALGNMARKFKNLAIHTTFNLAGRAYQGSVFVYSIASSDPHGQNSFVRLSFHSYLTYELRGTKQFGGRVTINGEIKAGLIQMALGISRTLGADGFIYGLEGDGPLPFSVQQLQNYLCQPAMQEAPVPVYFLGINKKIMSRAELIRLWQEEDLVKQTTSGYVLLDLLRDSDGWLDDEENEEVNV